MKLFNKFCLFILSIFTLLSLASCSSLISLVNTTDDSLPNFLIDDKTKKEDVTPYSNAILKKGIDSSVGIYTSYDYYDSKSAKYLQASSIGSGVIYRIYTPSKEQIVTPTDRTLDYTLYILTNNHVVESYAEALQGVLKVYFSPTSSDSAINTGFSVNAKLHKRSAINDLAVISCTVKLDDVLTRTNRSLYSQNLFPDKTEERNRDYVEVSDKVFAIGNPLFLSNALRVTRGVIRRVDYDYLIIDVPVNPGNSGGGLFSANTGNLVGINTYRDTNPNKPFQRIAGSITLDVIYSIVPTLER